MDRRTGICFVHAHEKKFCAGFYVHFPHVEITEEVRGKNALHRKKKGKKRQVSFSCDLCESLTSIAPVKLNSFHRDYTLTDDSLNSHVDPLLLIFLIH